MSEDRSRKTAKPTPKRISEYRKRGEIAISKEITQTATIVGGTVGLLLFASSSAATVASLADAAMRTTGELVAPGLIAAAVRAFVACTLPAASGALAGYLIATGAQLGWPPAFKGLSFDIGKVFSAGQLGQIFSPKEAAFRVAKATAKVALVALALVLAIRAEAASFMANPPLEAGALAERVGLAILRLGAYAVSALAALAAIDYLIARRRMYEKMKMTPEELKREHKEQEGDPAMRAARKRKMRELAERRHAVEVPRADVVLVNPTEYAVALRYDTEAGGAPRVVAKGRGQVAARIRSIARRAGVPILSRPPLTRLIHKLVAEGREIPAELYQVIAEILAYVYRLRRRVA